MQEADSQSKSITNVTGKQPRRFMPVVGIVLLSFVASFFGAWLFLATGLVRPDATRTITENREKLVLQEGEIVADVFKKVSPSTVAITTESVNPASARFFVPQVSQSAGSGIIISKDGYVMTNKHVVPEGVEKVTVILWDGKELENVKVVGRDPSNDLAFLKIDGVNDLTPAAVGDSGTVEPGQKVVAIGNALGIFRNSVSSGIISGIGRPVEASDGSGTSEKLENLFQTDAAINPGNSGGPLVNLKGEIIGINTAVSQEGEAIGFAIPINDAKALITSILKQGKISKPYLGVRYISLDAEIAEELKLAVHDGALIRGTAQAPGIVTGSPAAKAGLRDGDIITKVNGQDVNRTTGLANRLAQFSPGTKVELTILRDGKEQKISVTLEEYSS